MHAEFFERTAWCAGACPSDEGRWTPTLGTRARTRTRAKRASIDRRGERRGRETGELDAQHAKPIGSRLALPAPPPLSIREPFANR